MTLFVQHSGTFVQPAAHRIPNWWVAGGELVGGTDESKAIRGDANIVSNIAGVSV